MTRYACAACGKTRAARDVAISFDVTFAMAECCERKGALSVYRLVGPPPKFGPVLTVDVPPVATPGSYAEGVKGSNRAGARWTEAQVYQVDVAIERAATSNEHFTTDAVWDILGDDFPVTKGITGRLASAVNRHVIEATGQTVKPQRQRSNHGQRLTLWHSLIYRPDER